MSQKYTIDTIKALKFKVKQMNQTLLRYYTQSEFKPDNSFQLITEGSDVPIINDLIVNHMIRALEENETEFEAGKLLFENLKLNPKQASNIGYWTYHNHHTFYKYIAKRWSDVWNEAKSVANPSTHILNHWIQSNSSQGELIDYPISGLWWSFYLTVDNEKEDKYELTKIFFQNSSLRTKYLGSARFARHKPAITGILEFIKENNLEEKSLEQAGRAIIPYVNLLGGIRPLTYFPKEWFKSKLQTRFGDQINKGEKLFVRPERKMEGDEDFQEVEIVNDTGTDLYVNLNSETREYRIMDAPDDSWEYNIDINLENEACYIITVYEEGKIKKTNLSLIEDKVRRGRLNRETPFKNGVNSNLTVHTIESIHEPVIFGIAYYDGDYTYVKLMDAQNEEFFRSDNGNLNQEGKKVIYCENIEWLKYKSLPCAYEGQLKRLIKGSLARGVLLNNNNYANEWDILTDLWPELFQLIH